jgi:hypothetical protein
MDRHYEKLDMRLSRLAQMRLSLPLARLHLSEASSGKANDQASGGQKITTSDGWTLEGP